MTATQNAAPLDNSGFDLGIPIVGNITSRNHYGVAGQPVVDIDVYKYTGVPCRWQLQPLGVLL